MKSPGQAPASPTPGLTVLRGNIGRVRRSQEGPGAAPASRGRVWLEAGKEEDEQALA